MSVENYQTANLLLLTNCWFLCLVNSEDNFHNRIVQDSGKQFSLPAFASAGSRENDFFHFLTAKVLIRLHMLCSLIRILVVSKIYKESKMTSIVKHTYKRHWSKCSPDLSVCIHGSL